MLVDKECFVPGKSGEAKTKILKPSEAMRIGAAIRPQCARALFMDGKSCANGAIVEAVTGTYGMGYDILRVADWELEVGMTSELWDQCARRNNSGETRESIADWLESQGL